MRGPQPIDRRRFLERGVSAASIALLPVRLRAASEVAPLTITPRQTEGPFFPVPLPVEQDSDLVVVRGSTITAQGIVTNVGGRVLDDRGRLVGDARVEIWQCDANGRYHHVADRRNAQIDEGFQGYGRSVTAADGRYRFRTIRPVAYAGRTPHIHFKIGGAGFSGLTTQMYIAGEPRNEHDFVLSRIRDARQRASVIVEFRRDTLGGAELQAEFDIVLAADGRFDT